MYEKHEKKYVNEFDRWKSAEMHVGASNRTEWKLPRTPEDRAHAAHRYTTLTEWIAGGYVTVEMQDEPDGKRMFYRTVNGYEFGPEYTDDGAIFAMVALAVRAAGGG